MSKRALLILIAVIACAGTVFAETAEEIMRKSDNLPQPNTVKSLADMKIHKAGDVMNRRMFLQGIKTGRNEKLLLQVKGPSIQMKVLTFTNRGGEDQQWIKDNTMSKPKKIISSDREKPFVNSHLFYEDLKSRAVEDYTYRKLGDARVLGYDCYRIEAVPKPGKSIYDKAVFFVIKSGQFAYFIVRADIFYNGYMYKQLLNYDLKKVSGIIVPYKAVMQRFDRRRQKLGKTEVVIKKILFNDPGIKEYMFSPVKL